MAHDAYVRELRADVEAELDRLGPRYTTARLLTDLGAAFNVWFAEGCTVRDLHRKMRRRRGPKRVACGYGVFARAVRRLRERRGHFQPRPSA